MRLDRILITAFIIIALPPFKIMTVHAEKSDNGPTGKAATYGKGAQDELLRDLVKIPEAGATGGADAAREILVDILLRRGGEALSASEIDFLNRFELEYGLSSGGLNRYSAWTVQPLYTSPSGTHTLFAQGGYSNMDSRDTAGGDFVYRYMTSDQQALLGAHAGFDHQWPYHHSRITFGLDYKTSLFGARASHYAGLTDWNAAERGFEEKPMDGTDIELSGRIPQFPELELFTRGFNWSPDSGAITNGGDDIWGYEVATEYTPINAITLRASVTDDNEKQNVGSEGTLRLNYRFGMGWDELMSRPNYNLASVEERRFERVRRERTMRVQTRLASASASTGGAVAADCPNVGDTCADGSIFAGLTPDGNVRMYTTPADAGVFTWDDDGVFGNEPDTAMINCAAAEPSCQTGEANTALLQTEDSNNTLGGVQPHDAAKHCADLNSHGKGDWYLPSIDELDVLYDNLVDQNADNTPGGPLATTFGFVTTGAFPSGFYWSSSEISNTSSWTKRFSVGDNFSRAKSVGYSVRCVRKD